MSIIDEIIEVPITNIKPYWRNPRKNNKTVELVKKSIQEFGYNNLINVDKDMTIITGHARYKALLELGYEKIFVRILNLDKKQSKQFRIIDNKTHEFSDWDDNLILELKEIEDIELMNDFFNQEIQNLINRDVGIHLKQITEEDVEKKQIEMDTKLKDKIISTQNQQFKVVCPYCQKIFFKNKEL